MNAAQHILVLGVHAYRWIVSPAKSFLFGNLGQCRYEPSCSVYALQAIRSHGATWGAALALRRICRCHPWGGCGWDPVPPRIELQNSNMKSARNHGALRGSESGLTS